MYNPIKNSLNLLLFGGAAVSEYYPVCIHFPGTAGSYATYPFNYSFGALNNFAFYGKWENLANE